MPTRNRPWLLDGWRALAFGAGAICAGCGQPSQAPTVVEHPTPGGPLPISAPAHADHIRVTSPGQDVDVHSPLKVTGEARGTWFFEASFPVTLLDANGDILARRPAQARGEWMTEAFVPFEVELTFSQPTTPTGTLVLTKDNPSGLSEHDAEVRVPVRFE
jgi:hypothetical protein